MEDRTIYQFQDLILDSFESEMVKGADPLRHGMQENYSKFVGSEKEFCEGKVILATALGALAYRFRGSDKESKIRSLTNGLRNASEEPEIRKIVENAHELIHKSGKTL